MSKGYLLESDVENLALDTLRQVGYNVYKSPSPTTPNPEIDAMRNNDHSVPLLTDNVKTALQNSIQDIQMKSIEKHFVN